MEFIHMIQTTCYYLKYCPNCMNERSVLQDTASWIKKKISFSCGAAIVKLLHGDKSLDLVTTSLTLNASVDFILLS